MHKSFTTFRFFATSVVLFAGLFLVSSCKEEEPEPDPIASFQFEVSGTNFLEVAFTNFSQNAEEYAWDFGDGNMSTDENPTHTYAAAGNYTVKLTATNGSGVSSEKMEAIEITDPNVELTRLAGATSRDWYLQREGIALGIGPTPGDNQWWSFGGATPLGDRPCILDDVYTFHKDGTFGFNSNGTLYVDSFGDGGWKDAGNCHDETEADIWMGPNAEDLSAFASGGDYTFDLNNNDQTLTLTGMGTYIGLPNKTAAGDNFNPIPSKTYSILKFVDGDVADSLHLALVGDGFAWNFYLVAYDNIADLPDIPSAMPAANFTATSNGLTASFTNTSANSTSYSWDFGDGNMSTDENPTHTYAAAGTYDVKLTAMDDNANSDEVTIPITVSEAVLTKADLASETGKTWKLAAVAGALKVGPGLGAGDWWTSDEAVVNDRACMFDDEFIFFNSDAYHFDSKGALFGEAYMGVDPAGCVDEGALTGAYVGFASNTGYTFTFTDATAETNPKITVSGDGAFIGFNKGYNGGEYNGSDAQLQSTVTYEVLSYVNAGGVERIEVAVDISGGQDGTAAWTMLLEAQN